jgi:hypothetical protein
MYLSSCVFEKAGGEIGGCIGGKIERIVEQRGGQCMDRWKSGVICGVSVVNTIEFRLTSIIPSIRKFRFSHKIPTL